MYQNYESRRPEGSGRGGHTTRVLLLAGLLLGIAVIAIVAFMQRGEDARPVSEVDGVKRVSTVDGTHLATYDGGDWEPRFWSGMNMGDTLPGHHPGELAPTREDYLRWFPQMKEMNVDVLRVYTILEPEFYEALEDFNAGREDPLWLMQGVWSPEEELIGADKEGRDAYTPEITDGFRREISDVVSVVHGDADLPERRGHASGRYRADVSEYLLGWMVGTEWHPYAVKVTNEANAGRPPYSGEYFSATQDSSPFEGWLAWMLDTLAEEEMKYGWQHPASFTNWPTTDPLSHPNEGNPKEDLVPVDPMHVEPTPAWKAGYFSQYHVYPYYPDFMSHDLKYQNYETPEGKADPYAGYLHELRAHHEGIPLIIGEFGLPTARGMAHRGPLGRDQGYHTEDEQGEMVTDMMKGIHGEGMDGAFLFAWQDEWFKFTWNTIDLELPGSHRDRWRNSLTNEENFGVIATEPGETTNETISTDGETGDWDRRAGARDGIKDLFGRLSGSSSGQIPRVESRRYDDFDLKVSHDEAYLHLLLEKRRGEWNLPEEELDVGFGTLPGGSTTADPTPGLAFPGEGIQFLLRMSGEGDSRILVNSAYDQHTWLYADQLGMIPDPDASEDPSAGDFLPWRLALSRELVLPQTDERIPFEEIEVGRMRRGNSNPSSPEFDNLADWYVKGDVLEVRVPWMLLGFTDPSTLSVWDYPYEANGFEPVKTDEVRVYPAVRPKSGAPRNEVTPLSYSWEGWEQPTYHERKKKSFGPLGEAFGTYEQVAEPPR